MGRVKTDLYQAFYQGKKYGTPMSWSQMIAVRKCLQNLEFKGV